MNGWEEMEDMRKMNLDKELERLKQLMDKGKGLKLDE